MRTVSEFRLVGLALALAVGPECLSVGDPVRLETDPPQKVDVPYRLFRTQNMWNQLLLDTRDGRVWQIAYSVDPNGARGKFPVNSTPLVRPPGQLGRFTLYPTDNIWNFLLLDTEDGRIWQCQFSLKDEHRGIMPILATEAVDQANLDAPYQEKLRQWAAMGLDLDVITGKTVYKPSMAVSPHSGSFEEEIVGQKPTPEPNTALQQTETLPTNLPKTLEEFNATVRKILQTQGQDAAKAYFNANRPHYD